MKGLVIIAISASLLVACKATTDLPVSREVLELNVGADELVCHVKAISNAQRLSFHYGTSQQSFGTMATFRLIGEKFEITLVNDQKPFEYDLRAYDMSDDGSARNRTAEAFSAFKTALTEPPNEECRAKS